MYRWLSREFTTVECYTNESSLGKIEYEETVTTNREVVANHLAYTLLYMFLVADKNYGNFKKIWRYYESKYQRYCK